jgi:hypothetical protein
MPPASVGGEVVRVEIDQAAMVEFHQKMIHREEGEVREAERLSSFASLSYLFNAFYGSP